MKNFTQLSDVDRPQALIDLALSIKKSPYTPQVAAGKTLICIFLNPSLRTRISTQKAAYNLGMQCLVLNASQHSWSIEFEDHVIMNGDKPEHITEAAQVISSYCDVVAIRSFSGLVSRSQDHSEPVLTQFLKYCTVPVINLESCLRHPLQSLTDITTIQELGIDTPKIAVTWAPHIKATPQAVVNSFLEWSSVIPCKVILAHPKEYQLEDEFSKYATHITHNQEEALENADIVYVKNWSQVENYGAVSTQHNHWIVNQKKMAITHQGKLMHCLPVRRNLVIEDTALDQSIVIQQAANRVFAAQAVIQTLLKGGE